MTIASRFTSWQTSDLDWNAPPYESASPALVRLREFLLFVFGGWDLGIEGDRKIRDGESISSHAYGAALDWRWRHHPDLPLEHRWISRAQLDEEVIPFLIAHSEELGIQAIHDEDRVWRAWRSPESGGPGWKAQSTDEAGWLHIEIHPDSFLDDRKVVEKIDFGPVAEAPVEPAPLPPPAPEPAPAPVWDPRAGAFGLWPLNPSKPRLAIGSTGDAVLYLQGVIFHKAGGQIAIDGNYGTQTHNRVLDIQKWFSHTPGGASIAADGVVGRQTWPLIDALAGS